MIEEIETKRKQLGLTQEEIASQLGITRQHYSAIINRKKSPSVDLAKALGSIVGLSWTIFFEDEVSK